MDYRGEPDTGTNLSPEVERFLAPRPGRSTRDAVVSATVAGVLGAFVALAVLVILQQSGAADFLLPARMVALQFSGDAGFVDSALGLGMLLLVLLLLGAAEGAVFGLLMAKFVGRVGAGVSMGTGLTYGLLVWIVGQFVVLSSVSPNAVLLTDQTSILLAHVVYGGLLGILSSWPDQPESGSPTSNPGRVLG